ncbi:TonB-dependent receptor [Bacteroidota bacterium]
MRKVLVVVILLIASIHFIVAQEDTISLEDVIITIAPFEQRLSATTGSLSIIKTVPYEELNTINIANQLNRVPGVYISTGTHTTNRVTIRGVGSRTPYSSNRIRAYYDEIPLTNGDGISTIEDIDLSGISRMEILKGPASALYGSGLGGVILLKTLYPESNGLSWQLGTSFASFNTIRTNASIEYKKESTAISAGYARTQSKGFRENNSYHRDQFFLHTRTGNQKNTYSFHLIASKLFAEIPSSLNKEDYMNTPEKASQNWLDINGFEEYYSVNSGGSWMHRISDRWLHKLVLFASLQNPYESRPFNILDDISVRTGLRDYLQFETNKIDIQAGIELFNEDYEWKIIETNGGQPGDLQLHNSEIRRYGNLFAHIRWSPTPDIHIEAGTNFNLLRYNLFTLYHIDNLDQSGKYSYSPVFSPRLGLSYRIINDHYIHTSIGHGFSAPSLEETLLPEGIINPDLLPETGWNIDIGIRGWDSGKRLFYDMSSYTIFLSNMLVTERVTEEIFTGINAGRARLSGIEIFSRYLLLAPSDKSDWQLTLSSRINLPASLTTVLISAIIRFRGFLHNFYMEAFNLNTKKNLNLWPKLGLQETNI